MVCEVLTLHMEEPPSLRFESQNHAEGHFSLFPSLFSKKFEKYITDAHIPQPPSLKSKSLILRGAPERRFGIKDSRRGISFYPSNYFQDSSDPESEKTSFSGKILEK